MIFCCNSPGCYFRNVVEVIALKCFSNVQLSLFFFNFSNIQCSLNLFEGYSIQAKMPCAKFQLSTRMERKNLSLDEKMKVIDYANKNPKTGCRVIAEYFSIENTCFSNILRNTKAVRKECEFFKVNCKKLRHGQYHLIDEVPIAWYKKYASANVFSDGPMLKEEATLIKDRLNKDELLRSLHQMAG